MNWRTLFAQRALWAIPALAVGLLSLPGLRFPYLWDDFDFLSRAQSFHWEHLLPGSQTIYWRPVTWDLYFGFLYSLGASGPAVGHALNLVMLVFLTLLVGDFTAKLAGRAAGFWASAIFATFPHMPFLVAWLSACQDLMAMMFVVLALRARLAQRLGLSTVLLAVALLCKETSAAFLPVLASFDALLGRKPFRLREGWLLFGSLGIVWAAVHPAPRVILSGSLASATGGVLGNTTADLAPSFLRGILAVLELPTSSITLAHLLEGWPLRAAAAGLAALGLWLMFLQRGAKPDEAPAVPGRRFGLLALSLCLLPLLLTTLVARRFSPYYACLPFLGIVMVVAAIASRARPWLGAAILSAHFTLGALTLASAVDPGLPTIRNLAPAAAALRTVEAGIKELRPSLPGNTTAYVSVQSYGITSVHAHMFRFQCLRIWYRNPGIVTLTADRWRPTTGAEHLFWIDPSFSVFEIDLETLQGRGIRTPPDRAAYEKVLRRYAIGQAAAGRTTRAVEILTRIDIGNSILRAYDWRLAAALLLADGRMTDAKNLLQRVPIFPRNAALDYIMTTLAEFSPRMDVDNALLAAFGFPPLEYAANRSLMLGFERNGWHDQAVRFAQRVRVISDQDPDARRIIEAWGRDATRLELIPQVPVVE